MVSKRVHRGTVARGIQFASPTHALFAGPSKVEERNQELQKSFMYREEFSITIKDQKGMALELS
jgi:hypothetical protein